MNKIVQDKIYKAFKTQIYPTKEQEEYFKKCFGVTRFVYNWCLEKKEKNWNLSLNQIAKEFRIECENNYSFVLEINSRIWGASFDNLKKAYDRYFKKISNKPKFKSKKSSYQSFNCNRTKFNFKSFYVARSNPKRDKIINKKQTWLKGFTIKTAEDVSFLNDNSKYKFVNCTVYTNGNNKYYASFQYEILNYKQIENQNKKDLVGIDLGLRTFATQSDNIISKFPKRKIIKLENRIKRLNHILSKKEKGSKNYERVRIKLNKTYKKITNIKSDFLHKYTTWLTKNYHTIKIEDLNIEGMKRNRRFSKSVSRSNFYEFKRQLQYKSKLYNSDLIVIDRFYPSSKICSCCRFKKDKLKLFERIYFCSNCGKIIDRDLNAAINIANYK